VKRKLFSSRKFKFGAVATVFTALFIAAVILMNVIVSAVDSKFALFFDLTQDQIFTIGEETEKLVEKQFADFREENGEDPQILISFLQARDKIMESEQKSWVVNLAESYAEKYPQISVEFREDVLIHPERYEQYTALGYQIDPNAILITNTQEKGAFRYLTFDSCLVYDESGENVWAFQGEMKFNAAIIYITSQNRPVVTFTTGHGESVPKVLNETLTDCGFSIENVDLTKDEISKDSKILFMCAPVKDITYSQDDTVVTEYTKISDYLNSYGSMVVMASPTTPQLPVLDELLADWGLELVRNQVVMDDTYSYPQNNRLIYANYAESESVAATLTKSLTDLSNPHRTVCPSSAPINVLFEGDMNETVIEAVLTSSDNSYVEVTTENGTERKTGPFNLMAISTRFTYINNTETYGHLLLIGSENFTETNAFSEQFGNADMVNNMIRLLSDEDIAMETNYKVLQDYTLDVDQGTAIVYGIIVAVVIPIAVFALGIVVYVKRKHL
jgi:hypothetical protein